MRVKRYSHGLCALNQYIYVVSGMMEQSEHIEWIDDFEDLTNSVERYNILTNKWESLKTAQIGHRVNMQLVAMQKRYIIGFGDGTEDEYDEQTKQSF